MDPTSATSGQPTVLMTGSIGIRQCLGGVELLRWGYCVRGAIRNLARGTEVRAAIADAADPQDRLGLVAADKLRAAG